MDELKVKLEELKESWRGERDGLTLDTERECGYSSGLSKAMLELHLVMKGITDED